MLENSTETKTKKGNVGRVLLIIGIVFLILLLLVGLIAIAALRQLRGEDHVPIVKREDTYVIETPEESIELIPPEEFATMTEPSETEPETEPPYAGDTTPMETTDTDASGRPAQTTPIYEQYRQNENVINVLLLGRDSRNAKVEYGRTDSMILLSYNKETREVKLISLMRDMLIPIEGHDWNRINTAYAFGGIGLCINTLNDVFSLDIQNYITIDFDGLTTLIDAIGGVDVYLTADEVALYQAYGTLGADAQKGETHLNGQQALVHARNRSLGADFERTRRQRDILMAFYEKVKSSLSPMDAAPLISRALKVVSTNLPMSELLELAEDVLGSQEELHFTEGALPFSGTYQGAWYKKMLVIRFDIEENVHRLHALLYDN